MSIKILRCVAHTEYECEPGISSYKKTRKSNVQSVVSTTLKLVQLIECEFMSPKNRRLLMFMYLRFGNSISTHWHWFDTINFNLGNCSKLMVVGRSVS
jgi:hypothetical protein